MKLWWSDYRTSTITDPEPIYGSHTWPPNRVTCSGILILGGVTNVVNGIESESQR